MAKELRCGSRWCNSESFILAWTNSKSFSLCSPFCLTAWGWDAGIYQDEKIYFAECKGKLHLVYSIRESALYHVCHLLLNLTLRKWALLIRNQESLSYRPHSQYVDLGSCCSVQACLWKNWIEIFTDKTGPSSTMNSFWPHSTSPLRVPVKWRVRGQNPAAGNHNGLLDSRCCKWKLENEGLLI